jgi:hypothetical protein
MRGLLWPVFARSAWAQPVTLVADLTCEGADLAYVLLVVVVYPATVVAGTTVEGAALASGRLVGVGSASHYGGAHEK